LEIKSKLFKLSDKLIVSFAYITVIEASSGQEVVSYMCRIGITFFAVRSVDGRNNVSAGTVCPAVSSAETLHTSSVV
jgi:hypothetical protein